MSSNIEPKDFTTPDQSNTFFNEDAKQLPTEVLPPEVLQVVLSHLDLDSLDAVGKVNAEFYVNSAVSKRERFEAPFGKAMWEAHVGVVGDEPPLPENLVAILASRCPFDSSKMKGETHQLIMIPATIDGKNYSLNEVLKVIEERTPEDELSDSSEELSGTSARSSLFFPEDSDVTVGSAMDSFNALDDGDLSLRPLYGDQTPESSYWILMPKERLPDRQAGSNREALLTLCTSEQAYKAPSLLEATTRILVKLIQSDEAELAAAEPDYVCCAEREYSPAGVPAVVGLNQGRISYYSFYPSHVGALPVRHFKNEAC